MSTVKELFDKADFISLRETLEGLSGEHAGRTTHQAATYLRKRRKESPDFPPFLLLRSGGMTIHGDEDWVDSLLAEVVETGEIDPINPDFQGYGLGRADLLDWLARNSVEFVPRGSLPDATLPGYLDKNHPNFSPKLFAAIQVWEAMQDPAAHRKQALVPAMKQWLDERYKDLGLVYKRDGKGKGGKVTYKAGEKNQGAIDGVVGVANWNTVGGSPPSG